MRVRAVVAAHAALVEDRPDFGLVAVPIRAFLHPGDDAVEFIGRQHRGHRPAQGGLEPGGFAAARVGDDEVLVRHSLRIAVPSRIGMEQVDQGEHVAEAQHHQHRRVQRAQAVRQFRIMAVVSMQRGVSHHRFPSVLQAGPIRLHRAHFFFSGSTT